MATIQGVYVALFGRPADPTGLNFFNGETNNGADLTAIGDLASTAEYQARFAGQSNEQIITSIYQSLFDRNPEQAGLDFFVKALADGTFNINNIAIAILDGAQGDDLTLVTKKLAAADLFTAAIDTPDEIAAYQGNTAAGQGVSFIDAVTATSTVVDEAGAQAAVTALPSAGSDLGSTFTFTTAADSFTGTSNNDTFQAILGGADATVNTFDNADGAGGSDTLNVAVDGGGVAIPGSVTIANMEIVNLAAIAGGDTVTGLNSSSFGGVEQLWQVNDAVAVTVGSGVTAGFRDTAVGAADIVTVADGVTSASVAIDNVTGGADVNIAETTAGDLTSVTVSGSVAANGAVTVDPGTGTTAVATINLGITSNSAVTLATDPAVVTTVNASTSTGNLTVDASAITALTTLNGGSGGDTLTITNANSTATAVTVDAGAGVDTVNMNIDAAVAAVATTLTGGAGGDTFVITSSADDGNLFAVATNQNLLDSLVTISDFTAADDVLNVSGITALAGRTTQNVVDNAVTAASPTDLLAAVTAVQAVVALNDFAVFTFGEDAYVYSNTGTAIALDAGDALIKLTGVTADALDGTNFVIA